MREDLAVTAEWFRLRYATVPSEDDRVIRGEDDLEYSLSWLEGVKSLFERASAEGRAGIFTVDA